MDLKIVGELKKVLEPKTSVHAMWIAGSIAEGYNDALSDVDIWLDIDDGEDQSVFDSTEKFLQTKGELDVNFGEGPTPPFSHQIYHLANMDPLHFIEVTLHSHSHKFGLFDSLRKVKILFDKDSSTKFEPFDKLSYDKMLKDRKKFLLEKIELGELSVKKELLRKQFLDAMHNYQFWLVEPIIELARIKYAPLKVTYGLKHGSRDLPEDTVKEIESLYIIKSLDNLSNKVQEVKAMIKKYN